MELLLIFMFAMVGCVWAAMRRAHWNERKNMGHFFKYRKMIFSRGRRT